MDHLIEQCSGIANPTRLARKFNIVVVYESFVSAVRAVRACELLRQEIPPDVTVRINAWRMESLADPAAARLAASSAAQADLVILSTPGREAPPDCLHDWMDLWMEQRIDAPIALFTLFGDHLTDTGRATAASLRRKTAPQGVDFFIHPAPDHGATPHALGWDKNTAAELARPAWRQQPPREHESAFDTIENFAAHLRALFLDLSTADLPGESAPRLQSAF